MPSLHRSVSIRMSQKNREYCEAQGDNLTDGLMQIIREHREGIKADVEAGVGWLASLFKAVEFRYPEELIE